MPCTSFQVICFLSWVYSISSLLKCWCWSDTPRTRSMNRGTSLNFGFEFWLYHFFSKITHVPYLFLCTLPPQSQDIKREHLFHRVIFRIQERVYIMSLADGLANITISPKKFWLLKSEGGCLLDSCITLECRRQAPIPTLAGETWSGLFHLGVLC